MPSDKKESAADVTHTHSTRSRLSTVIIFALIWLVGVLSGPYISSFAGLVQNFFLADTASFPRPLPRCSPPRPALFANANAAAAVHDELARSAKPLDKWLSARVSQADVDSLSVAIVSPFDTIYTGTFGVLRANESDWKKRGKVDVDSIYRIASVSKMFTMLETLVLRDHGDFSLDDPVDKFIPNFTYPDPDYGWSDYLALSPGTKSGQTRDGSSKTHITIRQLASHMAGIPRDYPPVELPEWPVTKFPDEPASEVVPPRTLDSILNSIANHPLVLPPYSRPVYSNTGINLLGLVNVFVDQQQRHGNASSSPLTHAELLKRDVFGPLGLNSSFFTYSDNRTRSLRKHIAVPIPPLSDATDWMLGDVEDAAGGQYSSLRDLMRVSQSFLAPGVNGSLLSQQVMREWLRPLHVWNDNREEAGAPWEIVKHGVMGQSKFYSKGGALPGYHSLFALNPESSYGIVILMTGASGDTNTVFEQVVDTIQPRFDHLLSREYSKLYAGTYLPTTERQIPQFPETLAVLQVQGTTLYANYLKVRGVDVLAQLQGVMPGRALRVPLWPTGRPGEFRFTIGPMDMGCIGFWATVDPISSNGAPIDLIYFDDQGTFQYPAANVSLKQNAGYALPANLWKDNDVYDITVPRNLKDVVPGPLLAV